MAGPVPNGFDFRIRSLEEDVRELKAAKIDVVADRVSRVEDAMREERANMRDFRDQVRGEMEAVKQLVREENTNTRRALLGFLLSLVIGVAVVALTFNFS